MYREIAGTDERVRAIPGVRDRRVRATKVRLYCCNLAAILDFASKLVLQQQLLAILLQRCGNTGFHMQISFWQYCSNSGNIAAILAVYASTLMHMYALMESSLSLKYTFYYFRIGYTHSTTFELVS